MPILIHNDTDEAQEVTLTAALPPGWRELAGTAIYPVRPHETYPAQVTLESPATDAPPWQEIAWKAVAHGAAIGSLQLRVNLSSGGLPQ